jgi:cAMP phosphodiesterase
LQSLTSFLINGAVAIDAGCIGFALSPAEQLAVKNIFVSHSHSDHTASLPVLVAECYPLLNDPITVWATEEVIEALRRNIFNDEIWPDFTRILLRNGSGPALRFQPLEPRILYTIEGLSIRAIPTNHVVPTVGFLVSDERATVVITSDTYRTDEIWEAANAAENLAAIFVDVSYPNELEDLAAASKHLTPQSLGDELRKLNRQPPIYAVHIKPLLRARVIAQLEALRRANLFVAEIGKEYRFPEATEI